MIWIVLILAFVGFMIYKFNSESNKDIKELEGKTLSDKLAVLVNNLNNYAFEGNAKVVTFDNKRIFNLYHDVFDKTETISYAHLIKFTYSTGHLAVEWIYSYFDRSKKINTKVRIEKEYFNMRDLTEAGQENIASELISSIEFEISKLMIEIG